MKSVTVRLVAALLFGCLYTLFAQVSTDSAIRLTAFVIENNVPHNQCAELVVRLQWSGDVDRYEIHRFENPVLQNLEIQGSGSANRVETIDGVQTAVREYTFTLKPEAIGMGYIEPIIVSYTDREVDADFRLTTNRLELRIIEPIPDKASPTWLLWIVGLVILGAIIILFFRNRQTKKEKAAQEIAEVRVPIEEEFLQELKRSVDLDQPSVDGANVCAMLSKMVRRFLHERFDAPGLEATTSEVTQFLRDERFQDRVVNDIQEILSNADVIKFSGKPVDRPDVERTCTLIESMLQKSLRNEIGPERNDSLTLNE